MLVGLIGIALVGVIALVLGFAFIFVFDCLAICVTGLLLWVFGFLFVCLVGFCCCLFVFRVDYLSLDLSMFTCGLY